MKPLTQALGGFLTLSETLLLFPHCYSTWPSLRFPLRLPRHWPCFSAASYDWERRIPMFSRKLCLGAFGARAGDLVSGRGSVACSTGVGLRDAGNNSWKQRRSFIACLPLPAGQPGLEGSETPSPSHAPPAPLCWAAMTGLSPEAAALLGATASSLAFA